MSRETLYVTNEIHYKILEHKIDELTKAVARLIDEKEAIGDWISEQQAMSLTGLGKTTLYELRNCGKVRSSSLTERKLFYRRSDFEQLLNKNQK